MMKAPNGTRLAWELLAAARPRLSRTHLDHIHVLIGGGETFAAIDALVTVIVGSAVPLGEELVATVREWLDCYVDHDAEPRLRGLVCDVKIIAPQQQSTIYGGLSAPPRTVQHVNGRLMTGVDRRLGRARH